MVEYLTDNMRFFGMLMNNQYVVLGIFLVIAFFMIIVTFALLPSMLKSNNQGGN